MSQKTTPSSSTEGLRLVQEAVDALYRASFTPRAAGTVQRGFEPQHWGVSEVLLLDPDRRLISVQGPPPDGIETLEGHGYPEFLHFRCAPGRT